MSWGEELLKAGDKTDGVVEQEDPFGADGQRRGWGRRDPFGRWTSSRRRWSHLICAYESDCSAGAATTMGTTTPPDLGMVDSGGAAHRRR
jgi:hypothetical protein